MSKDNIICERCEQTLVLTKTKLFYQGFKFDTELMKCPGCGLVFIPEDLALGKILEIEQTLEDK